MKEYPELEQMITAMRVGDAAVIILKEIRDNIAVVDINGHQFHITGSSAYHSLSPVVTTGIVGTLAHNNSDPESIKRQLEDMELMDRFSSVEGEFFVSLFKNALLVDRVKGRAEMIEFVNKAASIIPEDDYFNEFYNNRDNGE